MPTPPETAEQIFADRMMDPDPKVARIALDGLKRLAKEAIEGYVAQDSTGEWVVVTSPRRAGLSAATLERLVEAMEERPEVRGSAANVLEQAFRGPAGESLPDGLRERAVVALLGDLDDEQPAVRAWVTEALERIAPSIPERLRERVLQALLTGLSDQDAAVRAAAARTLAGVDYNIPPHRQEQAVQALLSPAEAYGQGLPHDHAIGLIVVEVPRIQPPTWVRTGSLPLRGAHEGPVDVPRRRGLSRWIGDPGLSRACAPGHPGRSAGGAPLGSVALLGQKACCEFPHQGR
jgi:hypothetical protein